MSEENLISHYAQVKGLIETYRTKEPRLASILTFIAEDIHDTIRVVSPIQATVNELVPSGDYNPEEVTGVVYEIFPRNVQITWNAVGGASFYELRAGTVWETATFVIKTPSLSAALYPLVVGTHPYILKAISSSGKESPVGTSFSVVVDPIGTPTVTTLAIDNNVLIYWTIPASDFEIDHYNVYRNTVKFAEVKGNFLSRFETSSGSYTYGVEAVDIAGNVSELGISTVTVQQPPDYVLQDEYVTDFTPGTKINCLIQGGKLIACVDLTETYQAHFTSQSWTAPQDQIDPYERYIQENLLSGSYEEKKDYGTIITNIIVNIAYTRETYTGTSDVSCSVQMCVSDDDITYSSWSDGTSQFFESFRYIKFKLNFSAANADSMSAFSDVRLTLNVKREMDSGTVEASASDGGGTSVLFNKTFKDVDSVTAETDDVQPLDVVVDFLDIPNPTSFYVLVFDGKGQRVDATVYWKARGIV